MAAPGPKPAAGGKKAKNVNIEVFHVGEVDSSSWRMRDMAHRLLFQRYGPDNDETLAPRHPIRKIPMSSHFSVDTCLARIRRDKSTVVRSSFDAAAMAVLEAVEKNVEHHEKTARAKKVKFDEGDLPPFLNKWLKLEELRIGSLDRAHNNKDYAKRRNSLNEKPGKAKEGDAAGPEKGTKESKLPPKFTRNTPASSAAALDSRTTNSRAILCTAGNISFESLTPMLPGFAMDITDIPQREIETVNMGNVVVEGQALASRAIALSSNATRRAAQRYQFRKDNLKFHPRQRKGFFFRMKNPFVWKESEKDEELEALGYLEDAIIPYDPQPDACTESWSEVCLPRFMSILQTGSGHAMYHDVQWNTRHGRIKNLFQILAREQDNYGTHLIITTEPEVARFAREFQPVNRHMALTKMINAESLRALPYTGDKEQRRKLRHFFPKGTGLVDSPYHVIITSYAAFLESYLHFCQVPFEIVVVDDGASWMSASQSDPNSPIGTLWDTAIWSTKDQHIGLAGTSYKDWDFTKDDISPSEQKNAWIGLTARNRILTGSTMKVQQRNSEDVIPVSGLVDFLSPHFAAAAREEWDRSRIFADSASMEHFRKLLTRSTVVHHPGSEHEKDMRTLAIDGLNGRLPPPDRSGDPEVPEIIPDETFVNDGKVAFSRRASLTWLGTPARSWLRYELGTIPFDPILDILLRSNTFGHFCEEIITASSTTTTGITGQVAGTLAFRLAVRCNRYFGSEQGLRQHLSALHAPPGTWLCRTCGTDCITSQARTHHERSCGQPSSGAGGNQKDPGTGTASRPQSGPVGVVGKKKGQRAASASQGNSAPQEKDPDGSFRVPGYRGVWVNSQGKHFVKVKGNRLTAPGGSESLFFDSIDEAARRHDDVLKAQKGDEKKEFNYQEDGTRIIYEDVATSSSTGLGGSANNVVPALSVINIKDLPPGVKPLLRDPRQTSRTGGNSKRHVYAYRGVCRQARKGHDRWQSQISFMGVNHYLGTFDSEWDAAAIYAWAHLILYGEEATRKAQTEGEEAAAAYEQEKKDIAEGKVPPQPSKPEKKKQTKKEKKSQDGSGAGDEKKDDPGEKIKSGRKRKLPLNNESTGAAKKSKPGPKPKDRSDKDVIQPVLAKAAIKATILGPREHFVGKTDAELVESGAIRISAAQNIGYCVSEPNTPAPADGMLRPCLPVPSPSGKDQVGAAMLLGLSSVLFGWDAEAFVSSRVFDSKEEEQNATGALSAEYGGEGANESFRTLLQGTLCVLGNASPSTRKAYKALGLGKIPIGSAVGSIDCHIGGTMLSCSEAAASIRYAPTSAGDFQFASLTDDDVVTLNGKRITPGMGNFPLFNEDICSVGARVFVFLLPMDK